MQQVRQEIAASAENDSTQAQRAIRMEADTESLMDICKNLHGGNEQSEAANRRVQPHKLTVREKIFAYIVGSDGVTCEEIERALMIKHQTASARISELKAEKKILTNGTRNGYAVLWSVEQGNLFQ